MQIRRSPYVATSLRVPLWPGRRTARTCMALPRGFCSGQLTPEGTSEQLNPAGACPGMMEAGVGIVPALETKGAGDFTHLPVPVVAADILPQRNLRGRSQLPLTISDNRDLSPVLLL